MQTSFSIGDLAHEFGVTLRTLRFYEDKGLISPERQGLNRIYSRRDRARLRLILLGKKVGLSLAVIKEMVDLYDLKDGRAPQLRVALSRFGGLVESLERQKCDIEQAIDALSRTMGVVGGILRERETEARELREEILQAAE